MSQAGASGTTEYYDFDATGSTAGISSAAGTYVNIYSYLPFGELQNSSTTIANPYVFAGQAGVVSEASGFNSMGARFYASSQGRFISPDPLGLSGGAGMIFIPTRLMIRFNSVDPTGLPLPQPKSLSDIKLEDPHLNMKPSQVDANGNLIPVTYPDEDDDGVDNFALQHSRRVDRK